MCCVPSRFTSIVEEQNAQTVHSWHFAPLHAGIHELASCSHVRLDQRTQVMCTHSEDVTTTKQDYWPWASTKWAILNAQLYNTLMDISYTSTVKDCHEFIGDQ
jgi:hypothetical protein